MGIEMMLGSKLLTRASSRRSFGPFDLGIIEVLLRADYGGCIVKKNMKRTLLTALLTAALLVLTACGGAGDTSDSAALDDGAATRTESEETGEHYIDDDALALAGSASSASGAAMAQEVLTLVNNQRTAAGLSALTWNAGLEKDAQVRAQECEQSFSHTRPNGTDWWTVDSNLMYGENLAYNYNDAASVVAAWMASPTHKANILNGQFTTIGVAAYQTSSGIWYWAQEFGY